MAIRTINFLLFSFYKMRSVYITVLQYYNINVYLNVLISEQLSYICILLRVVVI